MANTTKNRLFYGDMEYNKTQGKTMPMLLVAFSFLRQPLSVIDLFRNVLRRFKKIYFYLRVQNKKTHADMAWVIKYNWHKIPQGIKQVISPNSFIIDFCLLKSSTKLKPL